VELNAAQIIERLHLEPHPEGGYYSETYRSEDEIFSSNLPPRYAPKNKSFCTSIYFLITPESFSRMHRLVSDEIFHFYLGDAVTMLQLKPDGSSQIVTLGPNILHDQQLQVVVEKNVWQGSFLNAGGRFALLGTTVAPGFDFEDFEYGSREALIDQYPAQKDLIVRLTIA